MVVEGIETPEENETFKALVDGIIDRVFKLIHDQSDSCCKCNNDIKSEGQEDIRKDVDSPDTSVQVAPTRSDCYPSLANLPEVCIHTSSLSNNSKQGEGDVYHEGIREAITFYNLDLTSTNYPSGCSLNSDEIVNTMERNVNDLSLDNNGDDFLERETFEASDFNDPFQIYEKFVQNQEEQEIDNNKVLQESQKFYGLNNLQHFSSTDSVDSGNSGTMDDTSSDRAMACYLTDIEPDGTPTSAGILSLDRYEENIDTCASNNNETPRTVQCLLNADLYSNEEFDVTTASKADKIPCDWEEVVEVQVGTTEPEIEDDHLIQTRTYWSNVGLIKENIVDPKYLGPTPGGIECIPGMKQVSEQYLDKHSDLLKISSISEELSGNSQNSSDENPSYVSFPKKHKNKNLISRLASVLSSRFRSKNKQCKSSSAE